MNNIVIRLLRFFPDSYIRSIVLNLGGLVVAYFPFKSETYIVDGIKIRLAIDPSFPNASLIEEMKGYNQKYTLKKGDVVIDAGAYTGDYTIYASKKVGPTGKVFAFEPDPYSLIRLRKNIKLNGLSNVVIVKKGLFSIETTLKFETQTICSRIVGIADGPKSHAINSIPVTTLDLEMKKHSVSQVDFVKMDIEGAELEALKGCQNAIKGKTHFAIASYHIVNGEQTNISLEKYFKKFGRKVSTGYPRHITTYS